MIELFPAIDLRNGKCVRLLQGDYNRQINYGDDPVSQAKLFENCGATWLHVVDLDGAKSGEMNNKQVIKDIVEQTNLKVEVGGGIRTEETISELLEIGVTQTVVGTRAVEDMTWFKKIVHEPRFQHKIVMGLDARDGMLSKHGWTEDSNLSVMDIVKIVSLWPLAAIVYTDIACDGMLTGPNIASTHQIAEICNVPIIASGGIATVDDIKQLATLPILGAITGRALYEKRFTIEEALVACKGNR